MEWSFTGISKDGWFSGVVIRVRGGDGACASVLGVGGSQSCDTL